MNRHVIGLGSLETFSCRGERLVWRLTPDDATIWQGELAHGVLDYSSILKQLSHFGTLVSVMTYPFASITWLIVLSERPKGI